MNRAEAFNILGLDPSSSEDDIKKKFKKLAKEKHPDVNKEPNAEKEYKIISEAFEYLKSNKNEPKNVYTGFGGIGIHYDDLFRNMNPFSGFAGAPFVTTRNWNIPAPQVRVKISFNESVLGCNKKILIDRGIFCEHCSGAGSINTNDKCTVCNGHGVQQKRQGTQNRVIIQQITCSNCSGTGKIQSRCNTCSSKGYKMETAELNIKVPGGIQNGNTMRLTGAGHLKHKHLNREEAFLIIDVEQDSEMRLVDMDVVSVINISLLDSLKGTNKKSKTVLGDLTLHISAGTKNKDTIKINGYGVEKRGNHIFIVEVQYPENVNSLIELLEKENNV